MAEKTTPAQTSRASALHASTVLGTIEELKALTPMQTMDEGMIWHVFLDAARGAKEKTDQLERKLWKTETPGR